MAIIRYTKDATIRYAYLNIFPDQFKTEKEKKDESWIKNTMDYFANKAYAEYVKNRDTFVKNYDLVKGILRMEDFYQEPEVRSFTDMLTADLQLPAYVKHYSIITTPINELVGEISKRPDAFRIKAFDDDSQSEELEYKTGILQEYVMAQARQKIQQKLAMDGTSPEDLEEGEMEQMTFEEVKDHLDSYTSVAEKWANHILTCQKADFNLKEKSEDAFRDMLISAREYYHIYEDNSKVGYNIEVANPKNTWFLTTPDRKYISDPTGRAQGAYAAGTVQVMELSEIIEAIPDLTKEEIDHLRSSLQDYGLINVRESNLGNPNVTPGIDSVTYDTYDPLVLQTRMIIESEMKENNDGLKDFLGLTSNVSSFGYKYVVVRAYWLSKRKIGKLIYIDELGPEVDKKVLGKFKDECYSLLLTEGLFLNPKCYSYKYQDKINENILKIKKVCKGVSKATIKYDMDHKDYINVLNDNKPIQKEVVSLRSFNHELFTYFQKKVALTPYYDKKVMLDKINCVPFGYKSN
jgi:hypothetical protein